MRLFQSQNFFGMDARYAGHEIVRLMWTWWDKFGNEKRDFILICMRICFLGPDQTPNLVRIKADQIIYWIDSDPDLNSSRTKFKRRKTVISVKLLTIYSLGSAHENFGVWTGP